MATADADLTILTSGDLIGLQVDSLGLLSNPSNNEPIPESEEPVSHLRVSRSSKWSAADYRRCMFKIENEIPLSPIHFGSAVQISHYPSGLFVVASSLVDAEYTESRLQCVSLTPPAAISLEMVGHKWIVCPKYKLREEGDPVRSGDYVTLRSALYKNLHLTSFAAEHGDHFLGLGSPVSIRDKSGLKVLLLRKGGASDCAEEAEAGGSGKKGRAGEGDLEVDAQEQHDLVLSTDYVRIRHREFAGHLIARTDDESELQSCVMPLGATNRKRGDPQLDHTTGVFLRAFADQQPREQVDFPAAYCSQGVWQVQTTDSPSTLSAQGRLRFGSSVRLRHLVSGQYLSVRPLGPRDAAALRDSSSYNISTDMDKKKPLMLEEAASQLQHLEEQMAGEGAADKPPMIDLFLRTLKAEQLASSNWSGKHKNSVAIQYGSGADTFSCQPSREAGNFCSWENSKLDSSAHMGATEETLRSCSMSVQVFREHALSGRTLIGTGSAQLFALIFHYDADEVVEIVVDLLHPETRQAAGRVTLGLVVNASLTQQETELLAKDGSVQLQRLRERVAKDADSEESEDTQGTEGMESLGGEDRQGLMDGDVLSREEVEQTNWVLATSAVPDRYSRFSLVAVDKKPGEDPVLSYNENFVFEHALTRQRLKLSSLLDMGGGGQGKATRGWWEYHGDSALVPVPLVEGSIIDTEVCQFDRVDLDEVRDIMYAVRFQRLIRAASAAVQLTPRADQLHLPMFRHLQNALLTLMLWTVGEEDSGSVLRAEDEAGMLTALTFKKGSGLQVGSGSDSGDKADSPVSRGGEDSDDEEEAGEVDDATRKLNSSPLINVREGEEGDETESEGEEGGEWDTNAGAKMVRRLLVHSADTDDGHGTIGIMDLPAPSPFEQPEVNPRHSSLAPWLGREVSVDALCGSSTDSALLTYATKHLQAFLQRDLPATEVLLRRQGILCDCHLVDLLTHFLDVLFLLQRAVMNTNDADMQEQYPAVPPALLQCSAHINNLLRAAVYRNEKVALKLISVQGSFMGMVSQKIMGWDPPLDLILMQTCRDSADLQGHSGVGPLDSQNQALVASSLQIAEGEAEEGEDQLDAARERERRERLGIEPILKAAISASDIRQVVEQMHLLHLRHDPTAIKIMSLLTLLCASGSAKKYLQKLLVDAIQQDDEALEGDFIQEKRSASLQTRCMLFHTQYEGQTWQVRFADAFAFSQQQGKKQHEQQVCDEELRLKLQAEGASLMSAFDRYDGDCNAVLDLCEAFCLLEDLGIGGPFLLKEVRSMEGCSAKGLGLWWCQRSSFYYPASSIAQCQLSPTQALEIMGVPMGVPTSMQVTMQAEAVRVPSSASVAERLDIPSLIAQRIPGYSLQLRDSDTYNFIDSDVFVGANPSRRKGEKLAFDMGVGVGLGVGVGFVGNAAAQARQYAVEEKRRGEDEARDAGRGGSDWIVVSDALREDCDESAWFRSSLLLLAEICKERNAYAQRIVSCLLPAECLIAVMEEDDLSFTDRSILCSLLANIYVDHMLVFPSRFSPHAGSPASPGSLSASASQSPSNTHSANMYLGYDEEVLNPEVTIGKLFNSQSRTRFLGEGASEGSALRLRLFLYMTGKLLSLQLHSRAHCRVEFAGALLRLCQLLLGKGFFQERQFHFFPTTTTEETPAQSRQGKGSQGAKGGFAAVPQEEEVPFTVDSLFSILVCKLNEVKAAHSGTTVFEHDFGDVDETNDRPSKGNESSKAGKAGAEGKSLEDRGLPVSRPSSTRTSSSHATSTPATPSPHSFSYFEVYYSDAKRIDAARCAVEILHEVLTSQQMRRCAQCWNFVTHARMLMTERAYREKGDKGGDDLGAYVQGLHFDEFLHSVFDRFRPAEVSAGLTEAVHSLTLYHDRGLQQRAFELLDRQLSLVRDAQHLFSKITLVDSAHTAFILRLVGVYSEHVHSYTQEVLQKPLCNAYVLDRLALSLATLGALHFSASASLSPLPALPISAGKARIGSMGRPKYTVSRREAKVLGVGSSYDLNGSQIERDSGYWHKPIPYPPGDDDFFELCVERLLATDKGVEDLLRHFDLDVQIDSTAPPVSLIDCSVSMPRLASSLVAFVRQLTHAPLYLPWHGIPPRHAEALDQVLCFLSEIGHNTQLVEQWFPLLCELLLTYLPESEGCSRLILTLLQRCRAAHAGRESFARQVLSILLSRGLFASPLCSAAVCAILRGPEARGTAFAAHFLLSRIPLLLSAFDFRTRPEDLSPLLQEQLHSVMQPLSLCFQLGLRIPPPVLAAMRVRFSAHFCTTYLCANELPLYLKSSLALISIGLHAYQTVPVECLLQVELRHMRKLFSIEAPSLNVPATLQLCQDFICRGVVFVVKKRIEQSGIVAAQEIHSDISRALEDSVGESDNKGVAARVGQGLRAMLDTLLADRIGQEGEGSGRDTLDLAVFQLLLLVLTVLRLRGDMARALTAPQRCDLLWLVTASKIVLGQHLDRVVSDQRQSEGGLKGDFSEIVARLEEIQRGLVAEWVCGGSEAHIRRYFEAGLVGAAQEQFKATSLAAVARGRGLEQMCLFEDSMALALMFPQQYLQATPSFLFLQRALEGAACFLDKGGDLFFRDNGDKSPLQSKAFAAKFKAYSDFELWMGGGGRFFKSLFAYLARVQTPRDAEYNLLHLASALLGHSIDDIQASTVLSLNYRLYLADAEKKRLHRLQVAVVALGAQSFVNSVLGSCLHSHAQPYTWLFAPLALQLLNATTSLENQTTRDSMMQLIDCNIGRNKTPEMHALLGVRQLIRKCNLELFHAPPIAFTPVGKAQGYPDSEHAKILRSARQLFSFVGNFCQGDYLRAQRFFSAHQASSKQHCDLISELCQLLHSVLTKFSSLLVYLDNKAFHDRCAPMVWEEKDGAKRRYLAWHSPRTNVVLLCQYMHSIVSMFDHALSLCTDDTAPSVQLALARCPDVLEFAGLMQLQATSQLKKSVFGIASASTSVTWSGGDPFDFYRQYSKHVIEGEAAEKVCSSRVTAAMRRWSALTNKNNPSMRDFAHIFGVPHTTFITLVRSLERKCLAVMQGFFECASDVQRGDMVARFDDGILLQNSHSTFKRIFRGGFSAHEKFSASAVGYVSLLESLSAHYEDTQLLVRQWQQTSSQAGRDPKHVYGAVEVVGKTGRTQRVYFPIPTFVSRYWGYPEVQKVKELVVLEVNRSSPEEKLSDYLLQMARVVAVMKRQELLKNLLTYPVHSLLGGKTALVGSFFPQQRMVLLWISLGLNVYYAYMTSLGERFHVNDQSYLNRWDSWGTDNVVAEGIQDNLLLIIKCLHSALNASLTLSVLLNSNAGHELYSSVQHSSLLMLLVSPLAIAYVLLDALWPLCMLLLSLVALLFDKFWLYVPCLFDVVFQLTFMSFLYKAVALNGTKIFYVMMLAFLCLYFYAVIATLYFPDQYTFNGHGGCSNLIACFKLHMDYGLYEVPDWGSEGYISPTLPLPFVYGQLIANAIGTLFNVSYVILINLVLSSIVSGLIIDTFSSLREENEHTMEDIRTTCFVCSISRDQFEQADVSFDTHTKYEHNMWHYLWFQIYLESKDPATLSRSEHHASLHFSDQQSFVKLMPVKSSVSLEQRGKEDAGELLEAKLDGVLSALTKINLSQRGLGRSVNLLRRANARLESKLDNQTDNQTGDGQAAQN